jgi:hypothetical protein
VSDLKPFVIVSPQGLAHVGLYENEAQAWRIYLGWPTVGEVREYISKGWYCAEAALTWQQSKEKT